MVIITYRISRHWRVHDYFFKQFAAECFPVLLAGIHTFSPIWFWLVICYGHINALEQGLIWLSDTITECKYIYHNYNYFRQTLLVLVTPEQSQHKYNCTGKVNTNLNPLSLTAEHHQTQSQGQHIGLLKTDIKIIVPVQCSYQWPTCAVSRGGGTLPRCFLLVLDTVVLNLAILLVVLTFVSWVYTLWAWFPLLLGLSSSSSESRSFSRATLSCFCLCFFLCCLNLDTSASRGSISA